MFSRTLAVAAKALRQWSRDRQALVGPMLLPLVLMVLVTVLFGYGGDQWGIGLVNRGSGPHAAAFESEVRELRSTITPYFRVVTTDPAEAERLCTEGRLQLVVTIPETFDADIAAGRTPALETCVFNINTDMTKNVRLRLDRAIQDYAAAQQPGRTPVTVVQQTSRPADVWRRSFIAFGAVILSVLVGAALSTATIVAREWERRTAKEIRLAPRARLPLIVGTLIAGVVAGAVGTAVTLAIAVAAFTVRIPMDRWPGLLAVAGLVALASAGLGMAIGAWLRDYRTIQPLLMVTFAGSFFAAGGLSSVPTLPPLARQFDAWWPPAYAFEALSRLAWLAEPPALGPIIAVAALAAVVFVAVGAWVFDRRLR